MAGKEFFDGGLVNSVSNAQKRLEQLRAWEESETNKQPSTMIPSRRVPTVQFDRGVIFLAAVHSRDTEEVERLVRIVGADVNSVNKDGLTALHQCCIDDDFATLKLLVQLNANVDYQDKEGWTPLHAAASCGHAHIVRHLLDHGAFPALVNNEGDTPQDLAEDFDDVVEMLQEEMDKSMIDMDVVRGVEAEIMLEDANRLKNDSTVKPLVGHGGATALHVAASKDYIKVVKVLVTLKACQVQIDAEDDDGWTPLHAAIYWSNFDIAEQLVAHGADLDKKTHVGDSIDDLCEPEFIDELNTLKKHGEQNNRKRSNAISQTKQARLIHSNSREDLGIKHPSPQIVRRRSSKERSLFPKIDIAKEREERENFTGSTGEYSRDSGSDFSALAATEKNYSPPTARSGVNQNATPTPSNLTSLQFEARDMAQEKDNSTKDAAQDIDKNSESDTSTSSNLLKLPTMDSPPSSDPSSAADSPLGSPTQKSKFSPKSGRKKYLGMSPKMLLRVGQWEQTVTSPRSASSGGRSLVPIATSTPSSSSGDNSESAPSTAALETKRYSFQAKTISPSSSTSSLPPRSMSESRPTSGRGVRKLLQDDQEVGYSQVTRRKTSIEESPKRGSLQSSTEDYKASSLPWGSTTSPKKEDLKDQLSPPEDGYRASSLPRGSKISPTSVSQAGKKEDEITDSKAVSTKAMATPISRVDGSLLNPRDRESSLLNPRDVSREVSVESNTSSAGNRSNPDDSETSRKSRARKQRQTRKSTQPVPADILEQLSKHDRELELAEEQANSTSTGSVKDTTDGPTPSENQSKVPSEVPAKNKEEDGNRQQRVSMSSYRPSARPTSRFTAESVTSVQTTWHPAAGKAKVLGTPEQTGAGRSSSDAAEPKKLEGLVNNATNTSSSSTPDASPNSSHKIAHTRSKSMPAASACKDESGSTPSMHPRTKSTTRRRPREKRRSTGIVAAEDTEELVRRSGGDGKANNQQSIVSVDVAIIDGSGTLSEVVASLRAQLEEEQGKCRRLEKELGNLGRELEDSKAKNLELNRRYQDATRAYDQERRENEMKDVRLQEVQNHSKQLQELKHENQRMKDENSALIRVIGKLSRSPLPQHHT